jgi:hypothetical protein
MLKVSEVILAFVAAWRKSYNNIHGHKYIQLIGSKAGINVAGRSISFGNFIMTAGNETTLGIRAVLKKWPRRSMG